MNDPTEPRGFQKIFNKRVRSAHLARRSLPFKPVAGNNKYNRLSEAFSKQPVCSERVIYINIPFCNKICSFCIYGKELLDKDSKWEEYFSMLHKQITSLADTKWARYLPFSAVYFGGGTPTVVPCNSIIKILELIKENCSLAGDCEITVESTISDIDGEYISKLKDAGVNRISLGVQSFCTSLRKKIGRNADKEEVMRTIEMVKNSGINDICIDLIYNLDGQDNETWLEDLELAKDNPCSVRSPQRRQVCICKLTWPGCRYNGFWCRSGWTD